MSEITLNSLKLGQAAKEHEERKLKERKRNLLILVRHYLYDEGYVETLRHFENEARLPENYIVCDNIDLSSVLQEYEVYYHMKFNKHPKICRKENGSNAENVPKVIKSVSKYNQKSITLESVEKKKNIQKRNEDSCKNLSGNSKENGGGDTSILVAPLSITSYSSATPREQDDDLQKIKLVKPLSTYEGFNEEWKNYANVIAKEIIQGDLSVKWDEVIGLNDAKSFLKEAIVYPIKYPGLFNGILEPWRGLLLYGPPGTGKTLLAKAVATECNTTFFNISASSIVSKWRGDSEKLVRIMFDVARHQAPSTIFLDELDALASCRGNSSEHEASRRLKAELLTQLDGLKGTQGVFLLAATNMPWELDPAILRRLEKKILIDIPNTEARQAIFLHYLPKNILHNPKLEANVDYNVLAKATEGYSGSDIRLISKETVMESMRHIFEILENKQINSTDLAFKAVNLKKIETEDVLRVINKMKPSSTKSLIKYREWKSENVCT